LATLAKAWAIQDGRLRVRQREQLRRALAAAAECLGWGMIIDDAVETATRDVAKLTKAGTRALTRDLADELASKKTEMSQLEKVSSSMHKLAEKNAFVDPVEVSYSRTAREADHLVTKTESVTLTDAQEAEDAAQMIEKKMTSWGKLREEMVEDLKREQRQLDELEDSLPGFVESSKGTVREVFATLY
jgi:hypothetical protein